MLTNHKVPKLLQNIGNSEKHLKVFLNSCQQHCSSDKTRSLSDGKNPVCFNLKVFKITYCSAAM